MPDSRERLLFQQVKAGDRDAFDRLQERLDAPVRRFIRRLVGHTYAEDEIIQDAFFALYLNRRRIDPIENLRPFLFRIVRNLCYDELRKPGRFQTVSLDEKEPGDSAAPLSFLPDRRPPPDEAAHWSLLYSEVQKAMEHLPEPQRQVMILRFDENLSYAQIAEATGTDIGTVKSRIHYARRNLVKILSPEIREALGIKKARK